MRKLKVGLRLGRLLRGVARSLQRVNDLGARSNGLAESHMHCLIAAVNNNSPPTETCPSSKRRYEVTAKSYLCWTWPCDSDSIGSTISTRSPSHPAMLRLPGLPAIHRHLVVSCHRSTVCMSSKGIMYLISRAGGGRRVSSSCVDHAITHQRSYPCGRWIVDR